MLRELTKHQRGGGAHLGRGVAQRCRRERRQLRRLRSQRAGAALDRVRQGAEASAASRWLRRIEVGGRKRQHRGQHLLGRQLGGHRVQRLACDRGHRLRLDALLVFFLRLVAVHVRAQRAQRAQQRRHQAQLQQRARFVLRHPRHQSQRGGADGGRQACIGGHTDHQLHHGWKRARQQRRRRLHHVVQHAEQQAGAVFVASSQRRTAHSNHPRHQGSNSRRLSGRLHLRCKRADGTHRGGAHERRAVAQGGGEHRGERTKVRAKDVAQLAGERQENDERKFPLQLIRVLRKGRVRRGSPAPQPPLEPTGVQRTCEHACRKGSSSGHLPTGSVTLATTLTTSAAARRTEELRRGMAAQGADESGTAAARTWARVRWRPRGLP